VPNFVPIGKLPPSPPGTPGQANSDTQQSGPFLPPSANRSPGQQNQTSSTSNDARDANRAPGQPGQASSTGNSPRDVQPRNAAPGEDSKPNVQMLPDIARGSDKKPTPPPPLSRLMGNKDFIITVDCHRDFATVTPGSMTFRWTESNLKETDDALLQAIKSLIDRRQASVQPGEPAYRPMIRLRVYPDGRNMLYRAYPLLERANVPMMRENAPE
jgi:hypothetical protein